MIHPSQVYDEEKNKTSWVACGAYTDDSLREGTFLHEAREASSDNENHSLRLGSLRDTKALRDKIRDTRTTQNDGGSDDVDVSEVCGSDTEEPGGREGSSGKEESAKEDGDSEDASAEAGAEATSEDGDGSSDELDPDEQLLAALAPGSELREELLGELKIGDVRRWVQSRVYFVGHICCASEPAWWTIDDTVGEERCQFAGS